MDEEVEPAAVAERDMKRWFRRRRILFLAIVIVPLVAGFLYWYPPYAIKKAHEAAIDCTNQIYRTGEGAGEDCRQGGLLLIPKLVPWTRAEAKREEADIEAQVIEDRLKIAARRDLDRKRVDAGVSALFALLRESPKADFSHATFYSLTSSAAEPALIRHAAELPTATDQEYALAAAIHTGDREVIATVARLPPRGEEKYTYGFERARGAVLCALGDVAAGVKALQRADELYAEIGNEYLAANLALAACDPAQDARVDNVWRERLELARLVGGAPAERPYERSYDSGGVMAQTIMLDRLGVTDLRDYLLLVAPSYGGALKPTSRLLSPWSILETTAEFPRTPAWADSTATRLVGLADGWKPPKPKKRRRDDDYEPTDYKILDDAQTDPRPYLRWAAMVLEIEAAIGWIRRNDVARAQAAAAAALALANHPEVATKEPFAAILVTPVLHLVGRDADALATADALVAKLGPDPMKDAEVRAMLALQRALILIRGGKPAEAWTTLDATVTALAALDPRTKWNVAWVRAALAVMLGKPLDVGLPDAPVERKFVMERPDLNLAYWYAAATQPAQQPGRRWHSDGIDPGAFDGVGVLPAQLYVVGKAAGAGDVELWLDVVTSREITDWQALASARAEAAAWRGDTAAADAWTKRLAAMRSLATDDRTAYLIELALED